VIEAQWHVQLQRVYLCVCGEGGGMFTGQQRWQQLQARTWQGAIIWAD
jgi:hypothetical protein